MKSILKNSSYQGYPNPSVDTVMFSSFFLEGGGEVVSLACFLDVTATMIVRKCPFGYGVFHWWHLLGVFSGGWLLEAGRGGGGSREDAPEAPSPTNEDKGGEKEDEKLEWMARYEKDLILPEADSPTT